MTLLPTVNPSSGHAGKTVNQIWGSLGWVITSSIILVPQASGSAPLPHRCLHIRRTFKACGLKFAVCSSRMCNARLSPRTALSRNGFQS
jgi:hypothetical protein